MHLGDCGRYSRCVRDMLDNTHLPVLKGITYQWL